MRSVSSRKFGKNGAVSPCASSRCDPAMALIRSRPSTISSESSTLNRLEATPLMTATCVSLSKNTSLMKLRNCRSPFCGSTPASSLLKGAESLRKNSGSVPPVRT